MFVTLIFPLLKPGGHSIVKNTGRAGSIVWGLGFCLGKDILRSSKPLIQTIVRGSKNDSSG